MLNLNIFYIFFYCFIADFKQVTICLLLTVFNCNYILFKVLDFFAFIIAFFLHSIFFLYDFQTMSSSTLE